MALRRQADARRGGRPGRRSRLPATARDDAPAGCRRCGAELGLQAAPCSLRLYSSESCALVLGLAHPAHSARNCGDEQFRLEHGHDGKDVFWAPTPDAMVTLMLQTAKVTPRRTSSMTLAPARGGFRSPRHVRSAPVRSASSTRRKSPGWRGATSSAPARRAGEDRYRRHLFDDVAAPAATTRSAATGRCCAILPASPVVGRMSQSEKHANCAPGAAHQQNRVTETNDRSASAATAAGRCSAACASSVSSTKNRAKTFVSRALMACRAAYGSAVRLGRNPPGDVGHRALAP